MELSKGQGLVIKMAQKNKETQTVKVGAASNWYTVPQTAPEFNQMPEFSHMAWQFYKDREEELYRRACQLKGIRVRREDENDSKGSEEKTPIKARYRYTLDEMKSYNPYRFVKM